MSKLILYSDFKPGISNAVDDCLLEQLKGTQFRIGYIPSDSDLTRRYFAKVQDQYLKLGISNLTYFDLGQEYDPAASSSLLQCDAIHLSGGEPYQFLRLIKMRAFTGPLKQYLKNGGLLIGVSAGAMILSKSLRLADDDWMDGINRASKRPTPALNLFDFEFYPHFRQDERTADALALYAKRNKVRVLACDDDGGVFLQNDEIQLLGLGSARPTLFG